MQSQWQCICILQYAQHWCQRLQLFRYPLIRDNYFLILSIGTLFFPLHGYKWTLPSTYLSDYHTFKLYSEKIVLSLHIVSSILLLYFNPKNWFACLKPSQFFWIHIWSNKGVCIFLETLPHSLIIYCSTDVPVTSRMIQFSTVL